MLYNAEMVEKFEHIQSWYESQGGRTPTDPRECFELYRWMYVTGLSMQHVYYHSKVEDKTKPYLMVELGTSLGASAIFMAKGFQDGNQGCVIKVKYRLVTIDDGSESDTDLAAQIISSSKAEFDLKIQYIIGDDLETLESLPDDSVDHLFADAQHGYANVTGALDLAIIKMVTNGRITGHDYDFIDVGVPTALADWRAKNADAVVGWGTFGSLWWMLKK